MKTVYFVRHGETIANRGHAHQGPYEPLSEKGKAEAAAVAEVIKSLKIDTLVTSDFTRARETAEIIGRKIVLPHSFMPEVVEFKRPASLYGKSYYSLATLRYVYDLFTHRADPAWENEGAENLFHIHQRMLTAQQKIEQLSGDRIVVVSHSLFMNMFIQMVCTNRDLGLREFVKGLLQVRKLPNTGIISFTIDINAPGETCKWWFNGVGVEAAGQLQ